jgi:hypothetical protein
MVETVIYMFVALIALTSALKMSKKNKAPIDRDLAFVVYATITALILLVPYTALKSWLQPQYAFATTILIITAMTAAAKRRRNV